MIFMGGTPVCYETGLLCNRTQKIRKKAGRILRIPKVGRPEAGSSIGALAGHGCFWQPMHVKSPRTWFVQAVSIYTEVGGWVVLECFACFRAIFVKDIGQRGFLSCLNLNNYNNGLPKQQATQSDFKLIQIIWNLFPPFLQVWVSDSQKPVLVSQLVLRLAQVRSFFSLDPSVDSVPWNFGNPVVSCV